MKGKYVYTSAKATDARHLAGFTLVLITESQRPGCEVRNMIFSIAWGLAKYYETEATAAKPARNAAGSSIALTAKRL